MEPKKKCKKVLKFDLTFNTWRKEPRDHQGWRGLTHAKCEARARELTLGHVLRKSPLSRSFRLLSCRQTIWCTVLIFKQCEIRREPTGRGIFVVFSISLGCNKTYCTATWHQTKCNGEGTPSFSNGTVLFQKPLKNITDWKYVSQRRLFHIKKCKMA